MFQVVIKERFNVVGDRGDALGSEPLPLKLSTNRQTKMPRHTNVGFLTCLVDDRFDQYKCPVSDGNCAKHRPVATDEATVVSSGN